MARDINITGIDKIKETIARIHEFSPIHNVYREDVEILVQLMDENQHPKGKKSIYRGIIHSFFSLVEADLYYYNQLHAYNGYKDQQGFTKKFKKTFEHICDAVGKEPLQNQYFVESLDDLLKLREIRNRLFHPKKPADVHQASMADIALLKNIVDRYNQFIRKLMDGFMFQFYVSSQEELDQISEALNM